MYSKYVLTSVFVAINSIQFNISIYLSKSYISILKIPLSFELGFDQF